MRSLSRNLHADKIGVQQQIEILILFFTRRTSQGLSDLRQTWWAAFCKFISRVSDSYQPRSEMPDNKQQLAQKVKCPLINPPRLSFVARVFYWTRGKHTELETANYIFTTQCHKVVSNNSLHDLNTCSSARVWNYVGDASLSGEIKLPFIWWIISSETVIKIFMIYYQVQKAYQGCVNVNII